MRVNSILLIIILVTSMVNAEASNQQLPKNIATNRDNINALYSSAVSELDYDKAVSLSLQVIKNTKYYKKDTLAKAYLLLANSDIYKGDYSQALHYLQQGILLKEIPQKIYAEFLLKMISAYYKQGNYSQTLTLTNKLDVIGRKMENFSYLLTANAYQASVYALQGRYKKAYKKLKFIEIVTIKHPKFNSNIEVLKILALANHNLGDYQTSLTLHAKLLQLQFTNQDKEDIEDTYYNLASAYLNLGKYDDAYNNYWQVKKIAEQKSAPIILAYAEQGIGETLLKQKEYSAAYEALIKAEKLLKGKDLPQVYFNTLLALAKAAQQLNREFFALKLLQKMELIAQKITLNYQQIELYRMLANFYQQQHNDKKALAALLKYQKLQDHFQQAKNKAAVTKQTEQQTINKNKQLTLNIIEKSSGYNQFEQKKATLHNMIFLLSVLSALLLIVVVVLWFKYQYTVRKLNYCADESLGFYFENPIKTKHYYQCNYKKARKFNYPLTIGLICIVNWKELSFQFNKKTMQEISDSVSEIIRENLAEFDQMGLINQGEFLLMFPHRENNEIEPLIAKINHQLQARTFANLGAFSVIITATSQTPTIQDIDPFAFLANLKTRLV